MNDDDVMLDASAVLALIQNERGAEQVLKLLPRALISAVNFAEVIAKLVRKTKNPGVVVRQLSLLKLRVVPWNEVSAQHSARFAHLAELGLSFGDRACITEAAIAGTRILTADRQWKELKEIGELVDLIR